MAYGKWLPRSHHCVALLFFNFLVPQQCGAFACLGLARLDCCKATCGRYGIGEYDSSIQAPCYTGCCCTQGVVSCVEYYACCPLWLAGECLVLQPFTERLRDLTPTSTVSHILTSRSFTAFPWPFVLPPSYHAQCASVLPAACATWDAPCFTVPRRTPIPPNPIHTMVAAR